RALRKIQERYLGNSLILSHPLSQQQLVASVACGRIRSSRFPKYLSGYSSMPRLFTEQSEEFFGFYRAIRSFFSDRWSELHLGSNPTERSTRDQKLLKKETRCFFCPFQAIGIKNNNYVFTKYRLIHPISSSGIDTVPKDELDMDSSNKISFLNKNPFYLFHLFHERKRGGYTLRHDFESEERFQEWQIYSPINNRAGSGFAFSIDSYGLDQRQFLKEKMNLLSKDQKNWVRISCGNFFEDPNQKEWYLLATT
ncbi:hypothetical protein HID58_096410, partial [Brassica napus]